MALIDKASLLMVPSVYEDGTLYNVLPSGNKAPDETGNHNGYDQTRADFTFSRGSNLAATRVNSDGLIEKGRENLLTYSNDFSNAAWTKADTSVTSGQADKDGGTNAWLLSITAASGFQTLRQTKSVSGVNTISIYAKANALDWMRITNGVSSTYFDIANGVVGTDSSIGASIESAGNGFFRCSIPFSGAGSYVYIYPATGDGNVTQSSGSIYIQNAQLEAGLVATDYIETGATTATAGVLENTPRIDYSSGAGALLLESQRTNLITQSEYFGAWTLNGGGTGSNPVLDFGYTSPEGVDNAYKVTFDTGAGTTTSDESIMYISKSGLTAGNDYTASVYLKGAVGGEEVIVRDTEGSYTKWTLTTEWKRYEMTQTAAGSSYATSFGVRQGLGGIGTINSNAVVYMYAFQSEAGSHASSYVPTYGSAATRGADSCSVTGVSDVIGQTEGTLFGEFTFDSAEVTNRLFSVSGAAWSTGSIRFDIISNEAQGTIRSSGVDIAKVYGTGVTINKGDKVKIAIVYTASSFKIFVNGAQRGSTATPSGSLPSTNEIVVNALGGGFVSATQNNQRNMFDQTIVFDTALTDAECVTLTTL